MHTSCKQTLVVLGAGGATQHMEKHQKQAVNAIMTGSCQGYEHQASTSVAGKEVANTVHAAGTWHVLAACSAH